MANKTESGVYQMDNGYWGYRFSIDSVDEAIHAYLAIGNYDYTGAYDYLNEYLQDTNLVSEAELSTLIENTWLVHPIAHEPSGSHDIYTYSNGVETWDKTWKNGKLNDVVDTATGKYDEYSISDSTIKFSSSELTFYKIQDGYYLVKMVVPSFSWEGLKLYVQCDYDGKPVYALN